MPDKEVLVIGDTSRWKNGVLGVIPEGYTAVVRSDKIAAFQLLFFEERRFDLCVVANHLHNANEGLEILRELREDNNTCPFIIYSDLIDAEGVRNAQSLHAHVIKFDDGETTELERSIQKLLQHAA